MRRDETPIPGQLPDYTYLCWGLLELYAATFDAAWLQSAIHLSDHAVSLFSDARHAWYYTSSPADDLIIRPVNIHDLAMPSGNAAMACNLLRLSHLCNRPHYAELATRLVQSCMRTMKRTPPAHTFMLHAMGWMRGPVRKITIAGDPAAADTRALVQVINRSLLPATVATLRSTTETRPLICMLAPGTEHCQDIQGAAAAHICQGNTCHAPITDPAELERILRQADR